MSSLVPLLLQWFSQNKRILPWRNTYQPYHIWISEIMLQQTQMDRVVPFFLRWIEQFPDIQDVANATEDSILKAWEGLGYYSRARNIQACARIIMEGGGILPSDHEDLLHLPGIGPYTAGAIMSIAYNKKYPVVDANVKRVFARIFNRTDTISSQSLKNFCAGKAAELVPENNPRDFNQALMELGALICLPGSSPNCTSCPLAHLCESHKHDIVHLRPLKEPPKKRIPITVVAGVIHHGGLIYIQKRLPNSRWGNLWEFPGGHLESGETFPEAVYREIQEETEFNVGSIQKLKTLQHSFTKYIITLHAYSCQLDKCPPTPQLHAAQEYMWLPLGELDSYAFSSGHRKLLNWMLKNQSTILPPP